MKNKLFVLHLTLITAFFCFSLSGLSQTITRKNITIDLTDVQNSSIIPSKRTTLQSNENGVEIYSKKRNISLLSEEINVPIENVTPFLSLGLDITHSTFIGYISVEVRGSSDKLTWNDWKEVPQFDLGEKHTKRFVGDIVFMDKSTKFIQFKINLFSKNNTFPSLKAVQLYFTSPGDTPKSLMKAIEQNAANTLKNTSETSDYPRPSYINRAGWGCKQDENSTERTLTTVTHLVLHHSAGGTYSNDYPAIIRSYWDHHVNTNGWDDIGYNWLIDGNGVIYKGRAWRTATEENVQGAHNSQKNGGTSGICMIGDFDEITLPSSTQWNSLYDLLAFQCSKFELDPQASTWHAAIGETNDVIDGHKDSGGSTACPGSIANYYSTIRNTVANKLTTGNEPSNLSSTVSDCPFGDVTFEWDNSGTGWQIHVSQSESFDTYYLKWVSDKTSYTGPEGFVTNTTGEGVNKFNEGTKYYWRIYYDNNTSVTKSFTTDLCSTISITLDDFENGVGHFTQYPTYSGSTQGILWNSYLTRTTNEVFAGIGSLKAQLYDDQSNHSLWQVRLLSGSGKPTNNILIDNSGYLSFWLKSVSVDTDQVVKIWIDDIDGLECSSELRIENDGNWHQYIYNLSDFNGTSVVGGNGILDGSQVSLDAIVLSQTSTSNDWTVYFDDVIYTQDTNNGDASPTIEELSLNQYEENEVIGVFPNPSQGLVFIKRAQNSDNDAIVHVINLSGVRIFSSKLESDIEEIDLHMLPAGIYYLNIISKNKNTSHRIMVNN